MTLMEMTPDAQKVLALARSMKMDRQALINQLRVKNELLSERDAEIRTLRAELESAKGARA